VKVIIRKARPGDLEAVNGLTDGMHNYLAKLHGLKLSKEELEEEHYDESDLGQTYVAEASKGGVVGYMSFSKNCDEWAGPHFDLEHLIIHEDYRRLGLARKLFEFLLNEARKERANIKTGTLARNKRALAFYKKLGFRPLSISLLLDTQKRILKK
jgi:ribosomal protein S18 acetylase RimI-like enzyme